MSDIDPFEQELSKRLRRVDAPASLADAVMSGIAGVPRSVLFFPRRYSQLERLAALLLLTALLVGTGVGVRSVHHRRAAEQAKAERDFARSQELTSRALEPVRRHLRRAGIALDE